MARTQFDKERENDERLIFIRAFFKVIAPSHDPKKLFEQMNDSFSEVYGKQIFKDYDAFRHSRKYYIKSGKLKAEFSEYIKRPDPFQSSIICPACSAKLLLK